MLRVSQTQIGLLVICGALLAGIIVYIAAKDGGDDGASAGSGASTAVAGDSSPGDDYGAAAANCSVTNTQVARPPGVDYAEPGWIGQNGLWVNFGEQATMAATAPGGGLPPGTILAEVRPDGSIGSKVPWWRDRRAWGRLRVSAIRRPGRDRLSRALYDNHLGPRSKVVPGTMVFPRGGCWQITARSGSARLAAVVWIVKIGEA